MGFGTRIKTTLERVGENVRRWRLRRGLTQAKLAEKTEVDLRFIQHVEAGRHNVSVGVIVKLCAVLDISPSALFRPVKPATRPTGRPKSKRSS